MKLPPNIALTERVTGAGTSGPADRLRSLCFHLPKDAGQDEILERM